MSTWIILTAANPAQARGYSAQLRAREAHGLLPPGVRWRVVPDPGGRRVGSGGSTLWVLHEIAAELLHDRKSPRSIAQLFADQRIIVIHSGGDSRRLTAYAAQGKVFTPLPCNVPRTDETHAPDAPAALFDLILAGLLALPQRAGGSVLLAAGDVLLTLDPQTVHFDRPGVVGVAYPGPMERGRQHGVYVSDSKGAVVDFLQKPDEVTARAHGAVDAVGRVLVDTGLVSLDPASVERFLVAAGVSLRRGRLSIGDGLLAAVLNNPLLPIDLYEQVLMALPPRIDAKIYFDLVAKGLGTAAVARAYRKRLARFYRGLHGLPFHVNVLPFCEFFHIGTSRELLANVGTLSRTAKMYGFENFDRSVVADRAALEGAFVYNSILRGTRIRAGTGVVLEACHAQSTVELAGQNIVVGWPRESTQPLRLPESWGLVCLPVGKRDWSVVLHGIGDDFKTTRQSGGTLGNRPLNDVLAHADIDARELWSADEPQSLWTARLWCVGPFGRVLGQTAWLSRSRLGLAPPVWRRAKRVSMKQLLGMVDHGRLIAYRAEIQRLGDLDRLEERLAADPRLPAANIVASLRNAAEAAHALHRLGQTAERVDDPSRQARLYRLGAMIAERFPRAAGRRRSGDLQSAAFAAVSRGVARDIEIPGKPRPAAILPDQVVWVTTPVRLDFAGGWSDTPPICTEMGGTVLNAAISLNGQYPVQVMAKLTDKPVISLSSIDLGQRQVLADTASILDHHDPRDWGALPKAAIVLAGLCPRDPRQPLARWLDRLGGGLDITIFSALPKGSGLGTSSILGAAMLACLGRVVGEEHNIDRLISRTSLLEQLMTTGGGWQDQVGGVTPGVKLIRTRPGADQTPSLHWTVFDRSPASEFRQRLLLYFTGYKRMARHILQKVVGRYLARDPEAVDVIGRLKDLAEQMKLDLDARNVDAFGRGVEMYWQLKKTLDPGSTSPAIESLLRKVNPYLTGKVLPGAGGGGFVFMVAKDPTAARRVRETLDRRPPNSLTRFFEFDVDPKGLGVTVL